VVLSLCQNYPCFFYLWHQKNPGMYEALELLGDERTVLGVVRLGWLGFKNLFQQSDLPYEGSFCCNFDNMIFFCYFWSSVIQRSDFLNLQVIIPTRSCWKWQFNLRHIEADTRIWQLVASLTSEQVGWNKVACHSYIINLDHWLALKK
jgi:hypothetical protein